MEGEGMSVHDYTEIQGNTGGRLAPVLSGLNTLIHRFASQFSNAITAMQVAKLASVMQDMSDAELGMIGVARADIRAYAEATIRGERGNR